MPEFTQDWFSHNIPGLSEMMKLLSKRMSFLEIGSFEGRSTLWFADQLDSGGHIDAVDTWGGSAEHTGIDFKDVYERFKRNIEGRRDILHFQHTAHDFMMSEWNVEYDFIYIDGSHKAADTLGDACVCWPALRKGGIMVFDDYLWQVNDPAIDTPKMAVDAFIACYKPQLEIVLAGYQVGVRKL